jgi:hypothetical protein
MHLSRETWKVLYSPDCHWFFAESCYIDGVVWRDPAVLLKGNFWVIINFIAIRRYLYATGKGWAKLGIQVCRQQKWDAHQRQASKGI